MSAQKTKKKKVIVTYHRLSTSKYCWLLRTNNALALSAVINNISNYTSSTSPVLSMIYTLSNERIFCSHPLAGIDTCYPHGIKDLGEGQPSHAENKQGLQNIDQDKHTY